MHEVTPENAPRFLEWLKDRGGIAIWKSVDLSDPSFSLSTPAITNGQPTTKPHWKVGAAPHQVITNAADVGVIQYDEIKRFRVGLRRGAQGLKIKVTDGGSRRIRREVDKVENGSYVFDYETQEAVILKPTYVVLLSEWVSP